MTAPAASPAVRPSGWWYLAAAGLLVLGLVLAGRALVGGFDDARNAGFDASVATPGTVQPLTIPEPGGYTIAYAGPVIVRSTHEQRQLAEDLGISITPVDGGDPLPLEPYEGLNDLEQDGQQYVPLLTVHFAEAGEFELRSRPRIELDPDRSGLVVSQSPFRKLRDGVVQAVVIAVVGTLLAILLTVILAQVRGRAKRAAAAAGPPPGAWPPPGGPPVWGGPGWGPPAGGWGPGTP